MVDFINMPQVTDKPRDVYNAFCHGRGESNTQLFFFFFFPNVFFFLYLYYTCEQFTSGCQETSKVYKYLQ